MDTSFQQTSKLPELSGEDFLVKRQVREDLEVALLAVEQTIAEEPWNVDFNYILSKFKFILEKIDSGSYDCKEGNWRTLSEIMNLPRWYYPDGRLRPLWRNPQTGKTEPRPEEGL